MWIRADLRLGTHASAWIAWKKSVDLHPSVYDTSCLEAAKGAASWATRWRTDDTINQASLQMIQCKPAKCSLFFSRKDTHLSRGLVAICFRPGPPKDSWFQLSWRCRHPTLWHSSTKYSLSNAYEYVPTLATNTGSVPKIPTEVSQLNEKSMNEKPLWVLIFHHFA